MGMEINGVTITIGKQVTLTETGARPDGSRKEYAASADTMVGATLNALGLN